MSCAGDRLGLEADRFRALALALPEAVEAAHLGQSDLRASGRNFATPGPGGSWGLVQLAPPEQEEFLRLAPETFTPASGAWGQRGATIVPLQGAREASVRRALRLAWRNTATSKLGESLEDR